MTTPDLRAAVTAVTALANDLRAILAAHPEPSEADGLEAVLAAHPVTEQRRCGNRISEHPDPPPGPPAPPIWCARLADGHPPDECTTYNGMRLSGWVRGPLTIEVRPPVVTYRCETCRTEQDHQTPTPCATLAAIRDAGWRRITP